MRMSIGYLEPLVADNTITYEMVKYDWLILVIGFLTLSIV